MNIGSWFVANCEAESSDTEYVMVTRASNFDQAAEKLKRRVAHITGVAKPRLVCFNVDYLTRETAKEYGVMFRLFDQFKTRKGGNEPVL